MAVLNKGHDFSDGDQVTADKLDNAVDAATFASGAVDNASTQLSGGAIIVKDSGITAAKIAANAVTTDKILDANVTTAKILDANVTTAKILDANVTLAKLSFNPIETAYPIGSIYMNSSNVTNPATLFGFGTWVAFGAGRVLVGIDAGQTEFDAIGETGGAKTHTLTVDEMPSHNHNVLSTGGYFKNDASAGAGTNAYSDQTSGGTNKTGSTGGGSAHNNLQPYIVVYMWTRTA